MLSGCPSLNENIGRHYFLVTVAEQECIILGSLLRRAREQHVFMANLSVTTILFVILMFKLVIEYLELN